MPSSRLMAIRGHRVRRARQALLARQAPKAFPERSVHKVHKATREWLAPSDRKAKRDHPGQWGLKALLAKLDHKGHKATRE